MKNMQNMFLQYADIRSKHAKHIHKLKYAQNMQENSENAKHMLKICHYIDFKCAYDFVFAYDSDFVFAGMVNCNCKRQDIHAGQEPLKYYWNGPVQVQRLAAVNISTPHDDFPCLPYLRI